MKISIVIPTIGRSSLFLVLEGLLASGGKADIDFEVLVVFDGKMSDEFKPLIQEMDERILFLETGKKVYASGARNLGIEKAEGEILAFLGDNGVPDKNWLRHTYNFHLQHKNVADVLLGFIGWRNPSGFQSFLSSGPQFDFGSIKRKNANFRHFYTSNISLKRKLLEDDRFSDQFYGWGFEDTEIGYRLEKKGMKISYDPSVQIWRTDTPSFEDMRNKLTSAKENALVFETLHPEVKILPRRGKWFLLKILIFGADVLGLFSQRMKWWAEWKRLWIG